MMSRKGRLADRDRVRLVADTVTAMPIAGVMRCGCKALCIARLFLMASLGGVVWFIGACGVTGSQEPTSALAAKVEDGATARAVEPVASTGRAGTSRKGSLLFYPHIEIKWNAQGAIRQDTFIEVSNDYPADVRVQFYFINGDSPAEAVLVGEPPILAERPHAGWNWIDVEILLTGNEPTYWSVLEGQPKGLAPFTLVDPGTPPGRPDPDPDNPGGRVLRGYAVGWAVDAGGHEIAWNHLAGGAVVVDYDTTAAWEYPAWAFQARGVSHNQEPLSCLQFNLDSGRCVDTQLVPGNIDLDGFEYDVCPGRLQFQFRAVGSALVNPSDPVLPTVLVDTNLTLGLVDADLRQDGNGPTTTKARFDIWNQNEVRFSGTEKCLTCWDLSPLGAYTTGGIPNHFLVGNLHTSLGRARVNGVASSVCETDGTITRDAALLGVMHKVLRFPGGTIDKSGLTIGGQGMEVARILFDIIEPPQEARDE